MTFLGTLQADGFSYRSDEDKDIMNVSKSELIVMRAMRTIGNIYTLLGCIIVGDVALVERKEIRVVFLSSSIY